MKKRIIQTTIALMGLVTSFLPQKAEACKADCLFTSCEATWICYCAFGFAVCIDIA